MKLQVGENAEPPSCPRATPSSLTTRNLDRPVTPSMAATVVCMRRRALPLRPGRAGIDLLRRAGDGTLYHYPDRDELGHRPARLQARREGGVL